MLGTGCCTLLQPPLIRSGWFTGVGLGEYSIMIHYLLNQLIYVYVLRAVDVSICHQHSVLADAGLYPLVINLLVV